MAPSPPALNSQRLTSTKAAWWDDARLPTILAMQTNFRLLRLDWTAATALQRYFMASQLGSGFLLGLVSLLSVAAMLAGVRETGLGLLAAATLCLVHTLASWAVLRKRYKVRYAVF
jgi:hypothetical protein